MLCDICHKNVATVHLTEIVNDKIIEMHICQACAKTKADEIKDQLSISDFLAGLAESSQLEAKKSEMLIKCSGCGLTYLDFKKKGKFGCASCYSTFKQFLLPLLKKIHGSDTHVGKVLESKSVDTVESKIQDLKKRLQLAIQLEEYEEAAKLRDEIKKLEEKHHKNNNV